MLEGLRRLFLRGGEPPEVGDGPVRLADVLDRGWLELFYQPKIELKTKRLVGAEGLVRARHPTQGLLSPGVFLPGASESDMLRLTERVIITALQDRQAGAALRVEDRG
jgi:sensor c-di-GMP phosphodiesterase-like protein